MTNKTLTTYIGVAVALIVVFGFMWFFGFGVSTLAPTTDTSAGTITIEEEEEVTDGFTTTSAHDRRTIFTPTTSPKNAAVARADNPNFEGDYLVDPSGRTLYTTTATCDETCRATWPGYVSEAPVADGELGTIPVTITLEEGGEITLYHYTWNGEELYYYIEDTRPGDVKGDGLGGVWSVVRP